LPRIGLKQIALAVVIIGLSAFVLYAAVRETGKQPPPVPSAAAAFTGGLAMDEHSRLRALSPEEEAYATALWPIHSEVKLAAARMTFAGLNYKIEHQDPAKVKSTVQPLAVTFQSAVQRARQIRPPESLRDAHMSYLEALGLYAEASREMIKIADDGLDQHLVAAHERSEQASHALLQLSDVLWPGEYKPN
jgi:hypothetical protein